MRYRGTKGALIALVSGLVVALLGWSEPAWAEPTYGPIMQRAADNLQRDPLWIDPKADPQVRLSMDKLYELRQLIARVSKHCRIYMAILPEAVRSEVPAGGQLTNALAAVTDRNGIYAIISGPLAGDATSFQAVAMPEGLLPEAPDLATGAFYEQGGTGIYDVLRSFAEHAQAAAMATPDPNEADSSQSDYHWRAWMLLAGVVGCSVLWLVWRVRRAHRRRRQPSITPIESDYGPFDFPPII